MRYLSQPPANDNGRPPWFPVFPELLERPDLSRTDVLVYGALHAFAAAKMRTRVADLAAALGSPSSKSWIRESIRSLEAARLIRRDFVRGRATRYVPLGPMVGNG